MRYFLLFPLVACSAIPRAADRTVAADVAPAEATPPVPDQPEELGHVHWGRDLPAAKQASRRSGKPVLVLFDEVPGCSTVKGFGNGALTHPLLVEAIETLYEPVLVYNNKTDDAELLASFGEPSWNNPVVRILDGDDTRARFSGPYTEAAFATFLADNLPTTPAWLDLVATELGATKTETATYAMGCFWSGEAHLGAADGVVATRTGWQGGREVVEVTYDTERTDAQSLAVHASEKGYRHQASGRLRATPKDDRHALRSTKWGSVPMTPLQASKANALVAVGKDPSALLSPRQRARAGGSATGAPGATDLRAAWR